MKNYVITSGAFTANGNFTGYTALGKRLFIHKRVMESQKIAKNEDVKFPIYVVGDTVKIGQLDENGEAKLNADGSPVKVDRLQALSLFLTKEALVSAQTDEATLNIEVSAAVSVKASTAGLTKEQIGKLLEASI